MNCRLLLAPLALLALSLAGAPAAAAGRLPPPNLATLLSEGTVDALAGSLRGYLVRSLPPTLYEASPGWGRTVRVANGVKWHGKGPEISHGMRNDGAWRKVAVTAGNLADTLIFDLRDFQQPEPGRMTFSVFVSFDARMDYVQQNWKAGLKLYDGSVRARFRVKLLLQCEARVRLEANGSVLPDAVFRLRVSKAELHYDNLVVEHVAGVGGEAAKLLGDAAKGGLRQWYPSLERELLARTDAAIARAGDTKEVRVNLLGLLKR